MRPEQCMMLSTETDCIGNQTITRLYGWLDDLNARHRDLTAATFIFITGIQLPGEPDPWVPFLGWCEEGFCQQMLL